MKNHQHIVHSTTPPHRVVIHNHRYHHCQWWKSTFFIGGGGGWWYSSSTRRRNYVPTRTQLEWYTPHLFFIVSVGATILDGVAAVTERGATTANMMISSESEWTVRHKRKYGSSLLMMMHTIAIGSVLREFSAGRENEALSIHWYALVNPTCMGWTLDSDCHLRLDIQIVDCGGKIFSWDVIGKRSTNKA